MLTPAERKTLKARAHALDPVVLVGDAGLTAGVLAEIDRSLTSHELIKVRVAGDDREARLAMRDRVVAELSAEPVQAIGKLLVFFREAVAEEPKDPWGTRAAAGRKAVAKKTAPPRYAGTKTSTRKVKADTSPPRTARVRKSGQRSSKKAHQSR